MFSAACGKSIGLARAQQQVSLGTTLLRIRSRDSRRVRPMSQKFKPKNPDRGQRRSAAWGKRLSMLLVLLVAQVAFATQGDGKPVGKFASDLAPVLARAHQGKAGVQTGKVIVQYEKVPQARQENQMLGLGAHLNHPLGTGKALALSIPMSAAPAVQSDPDVLSLSIHHP